MAKKKIEDEIVAPSNDNLSRNLIDFLNKEYKDMGKVAYALADADNPVHVTEFISTGSTALDLAISNRKNGGFPVGKITELGGLKQSSKSLVAAHALAETQRKGGLAILFDTESAASNTFMEAIGVNTKDLVHLRFTTVEDIFAAIEKLAARVRATGSKQLITIVIDSMAGATTKREDAAEFEQMGWNTSKAILLSQSMRKITDFISVNRICLIITNQLRVNLAVTMGDNYCVDPFTTKIKIKHQNVVEEIMFDKFSERFLLNNDFTTPQIFDISHEGIEVETLDADGNLVWQPIKSFVVKPSVETHYTDGKLKGTNNHRIIENGKDIHLKDHPDFYEVLEPMKVVDIEVANTHSYLANGRLNHNTSAGGLAIPYHSTVQIRLKNKGKIEVTVGGEKEIVGAKVEALVFKNRLGPPFRTATFNVFFDRGIDDLNSWIDILVSEDLVVKDKLSYLWTSPNTGEELKFTAQKLPSILTSRPDVKEEMYEQICNAKILQYKTSEFTEDEIAVILKEEIDQEELDASF